MPEQVRNVSLSELADNLRPLIRQGLPVVDETAGDLLPYVRSVKARAVDSDRLSLVIALDAELRDILAGLGDGPRAEATRVLFASQPRLRGTTLTYRRTEAARILDYSLDHFRDRIEPEIRTEIAYELHARSLKYRPRLPDDLPKETRPADLEGVSDIDELELQERHSRIWAFYYAARADATAIRRLREGSSAGGYVRRLLERSFWSYVKLLETIADYIEHHGRYLVQTGNTISVENVIKTAGMHPPFTDQETQWLRLQLAQVDEDELGAFTAKLRAEDQGRELLERWRGWMEEVE